MGAKKDLKWAPNEVFQVMSKINAWNFSDFLHGVTLRMAWRIKIEFNDFWTNIFVLKFLDQKGSKNAPNSNFSSIMIFWGWWGWVESYIWVFGAKMNLFQVFMKNFMWIFSIFSQEVLITYNLKIYLSDCFGKSLFLKFSGSWIITE